MTKIEKKDKTKSLTLAAKFLLGKINENSINRICTLQDKELADRAKISYDYVTKLISQLKKAKKIETKKTSSTGRDIIIIDSEV